MAFDMSGYVSVADRIAAFRTKHPGGSLRPLDPHNPYRLETIGDQTFVVYAAAAYRTPDDLAPGVGIAWECMPGRTSYTKDSELQNAETSAWGRAIMASLAADSRVVASADEVRNGPVAAAEAAENEQRAAVDAYVAAEQIRLSNRRALLTEGMKVELRAWCMEQEIPLVPAEMSEEQLTKVNVKIDELVNASNQPTPAKPELPPVDGNGRIETEVVAMSLGEVKTKLGEFGAVSSGSGIQCRERLVGLLAAVAADVGPI